MVKINKNEMVIMNAEFKFKIIETIAGAVVQTLKGDAVVEKHEFTKKVHAVRFCLASIGMLSDMDDSMLQM